MQAIKAEIRLRVYSTVRDDARNDVKIKAVVRQVQLKEPFGCNVLLKKEDQPLLEPKSKTASSSGQDTPEETDRPNFRLHHAFLSFVVKVVPTSNRGRSTIDFSQCHETIRTQKSLG